MDDGSSEDPAAAVAMLAGQQDSRRASHQQASASGREDSAPEDVFRRFDRVVDDWLVRLIQTLLSMELWYAGSF